MSQTQPEHPFRFFDNRGKYLLFVTCGSSKPRTPQQPWLSSHRPDGLSLVKTLSAEENR